MDNLGSLLNQGGIKKTFENESRAVADFLIANWLDFV